MPITFSNTLGFPGWLIHTIFTGNTKQDWLRALPSFLLFAALLIWPRQTLEQPILLVYAFGIALVNLIIAKLTLDYFFEK